VACKSETREIGNKQVYVIQWPATKAMEMQVRMMNALGDTALPLVYGEWELNHFSYILTNCNINMFTTLVKDCCIGVRIDSKEINSSTFDTELSGDLLFMYKVFAFVLEVNFKDFFEQGQQTKDSSK
jgi:hypothetical protein